MEGEKAALIKIKELRESRGYLYQDIIENDCCKWGAEQSLKKKIKSNTDIFQAELFQDL